MQHKGWAEEQIRAAIRHTTEGVRDVLAYVAAHPRCTSRGIAEELGLTSARSVGPTLNALTRTAEELGVHSRGEVRWFFEWPGKVDGWEQYDFPDWVRDVVKDELGVR